MTSGPLRAVQQTSTMLRQVRAWDKVVGRAAEDRSGWGAASVLGPLPPKPRQQERRWWERAGASLAAATGAGALLGTITALLTGDPEALVLGTSVPTAWGGVLALGMGPGPSREREPQRTRVRACELPLVLAHLLGRTAAAQGRIRGAVGTLDPDAVAATDEAAWNLAQGLVGLRDLGEAYQADGICDNQGRLSPSMRWLKNGPLEEACYLLAEQERVLQQVELLEAAAREAVIVAHESRRTVDAGWDVERARDLRGTLGARADALRALTGGKR